MTYAQERIAEVWDEAWPLIVANAHETALSDIPFQPNRRHYEELERLGVMRLYTARVGGVLVGYTLFLVSFHPQYAGTKMAIQEVLYMDPAHRGFGAARFIVWSDDKLKAEGAGAVMRQVRHGAADYGRTLERMGYVPTQLSYLKRF